MKGGYQIINLHGIALSDSAVTIPKVYESIEGNYHKPILLSDINIDSVERADIYAQVSVDGTNYVISNVYGGTITITDDDSITYTKNA